MNTIDKTYAVRGKPVELQELRGLYAMRAPASRSARSFGFLGDFAVPENAEIDLRAFEGGGWKFVNSSKNAFLPSQSGSAPQGAKVYLRKPSGKVLLGTGRLTVGVNAQLPSDQAVDLLRSRGLTVVDRLKFAPNLFSVSVPEGEDAIDVVNQLAKDGQIEFAEPELIEPLNGHR